MMSGTRVLSVRPKFGSVSRCPNGCFHVSLPNLTFRVTETEYRVLLDMLAEAAEAACEGIEPSTRH
jgi:hypothetical protein